MALLGLVACSGSQESREVPQRRSESGGRLPESETSPDKIEAGAANTAASVVHVPVAGGKVQVENPDPRLSVLYRGNAIIISHAIVHRHANPCDFSGEKPELDSLVDFHVELEVLFDSLPAAVRKREAGSLVAEKFVDGNAVGTEPGFLEEVMVGNRKGYRILMGAEGCGETVFYLPTGPWTLRMARRRVAEFDPAANPNTKSVASLPGIISPREAEKLADRILASAQITGSGKNTIP